MTFPCRLISFSRNITKLCLICVATFMAAPQVHADIVLSIQSVTVSAGSSGNGLDVELTNTGPSALAIGGFSFGITTPNSSISFTDANVSTSAPYIFFADSLFGPDIATATGQSLIASDVFDVPFGGASLASGSTVGLGHLSFDVTAGAAPGLFPVTALAFPVTSLADANGNDVPIQTLSPGTITIQAATVPEPSSLPLLATGIALLIICERKRRSGTKVKASTS